MSEFLDLQGLKVYDGKVKQYIDDKVADMTGITLNGEKGYELIADGLGNVPKWKQPTGYLVNLDTDAIRTVACSNFALLTGVQATIKFTYAFTSQGSAKLNINNTGAKSLLWKDGTAITSANSWAAGDILTVIYDGTNYIILGITPPTPTEIVNTLKSAMVDLLYPVGTVMTFVNTVDPNTQFGGTWEQIKGQFLFGAEDSGDYTLGADGGSKDAVVVSHRHYQNQFIHDSSVESWAGNNVELGNERHVRWSPAYADIAYAESTGTWTYTPNFGDYTRSTGEDGTSKNMPPYLCVNIWKRTA